jgi:hypothetical protein
VRRSAILWALLLVLYLVFRLWYDGRGVPLAQEEVQRYVGILEQRVDADPERIATVREFLANDDGSEFVMANFIHLQDQPSAQADLDRYMAHMVPALVARACHPVLAGPVVGGALELWGLENAGRWSLVGLVRYRSRRDMIEIATDPAFRDAHAFKLAAMQQTIAVPLQPFLAPGSPRWLVAGVLALLGLLLELLFRLR